MLCNKVDEKCPETRGNISARRKRVKSDTFRPLFAR